MAHRPETRQQLRGLYVHKGLGLDQAARSLDVSGRTASRWKQEALSAGDDWDKARAANLLAGEGAEAVSRAVLEDFLNMFQSTLESLRGEGLKPLEKAEAMSRLADAYTKTTKAIQRSAPELSRLAVASEVIQAFAQFIKARHPALAPALLEVLEPFSEHVVTLYG